MAGAGDMNRSRELYVAFAFAAADMLVEVEPDGTIGFAVGASMALAGKPARLLTGVPLTEVFVPEEATQVVRALHRIDEGERIRYLLLHSPGKPPKPVALAGYRHPHRPDARLVALTHARALESLEVLRVPATGLMKADNFTDLAKRMLNEGAAPGADTAYQLTLLEVPQVEEVRTQIGPAAADDFLAELGDVLKGSSVGGDSAGELGDNRFGLIHAPTITPGEIEDQIAQLIQHFLPSSEPVVLKHASLALDVEGISSEEAANALLYTLNAFSKDSSVSLDRILADVPPRLSRTVEHMRQVKAVIERGEFELVFQPIVDLWTEVVHHFECLVRFPGQDSPFETVTFAENVGIVGSLDLAILTRAIEFMRSPAGKHESLRFAVNLSGRSLSHPTSARKLLELAESARDLNGRLLFELTESAEVENLPAVNGILQVLRRMGFPICLDDFGAGSAAFHYLRALKVDHVKIDGSYIKDMAGNNDSAPFLRSIAALCGELRVGTIAEYVENAEIANLLKLLRVRYGQGYYYSRPMIPATDGTHPLHGWAVNGMAWQNGLLMCRRSNG